MIHAKAFLSNKLVCGRHSGGTTAFQPWRLLQIISDLSLVFPGPTPNTWRKVEMTCALPSWSKRFIKGMQCDHPFAHLLH